MTLNDFYANAILEFICKYAPYLIQRAKKLGGNPRQTIKKFILKHIEYNTIVVLWDKGDVIGCCNFDVDGEVAHVRDCVVHPNYRNKNVLKQLTMRALTAWPFLKRITFSRDMKNNKTQREIVINKFLKLSPQGI